ncbi:hypothetical protein JCM19236_3803 [Vibrio sp. JCM 19236]|nr:hypothetical protein JCM19236_3803 [Vibrio sp. JCM 19236]
MNKFSTEQLKSALIELSKSDNLQAYQLAFDELESRLNEVTFDAFLDEAGL